MRALGWISFRRSTFLSIMFMNIILDSAELNSRSIVGRSKIKMFQTVRKDTVEVCSSAASGVMILSIQLLKS